LACHYCDYKIAHPNVCVECGSSELTPMGHGTERLEAELHDFFPSAKVARLDSDALRKADIRNKIFKKMDDGKIDILIGTQIITKGHDFPGVTLVGIILAESSLHLPDFRANERTFQLITQVAGRAGRAHKPGKVYIQTYQPEQFVLQCAINHDFKLFYKRETSSRKELHYPPFTRLANFRFQGNDVKKVKAAAQLTARLIQTSISEKDANLLGPAPSPLERVRGKYRWQILLKAIPAQALANFAQNAQQHVEKQLPAGVRMTIDMDPIKLL